MALLMTALLITACATHSQQDPDDTQGGPTESVFASGWAEIDIISSGAKVVIDQMAHWTTSRNACWKEDDGAMTLADWNTLAGEMNQAMQLPPLRSENCWSPDMPDWALDGVADVKISKTATRSLFDVRGGEVCTTISDPEVASAILKTIDKTLLAAAYQSCPH